MPATFTQLHIKQLDIISIGREEAFMANPQVVSLITTSLVGVALVSAVVEDAQAQSAAGRAARAAAYADCQTRADAAVPRMTNTTDQMNHYMSFAGCLQERGFSVGRSLSPRRALASGAGR
jgi:hypothetical protein